VSPRVGLDAVEKRKILHYLESNVGHLACTPSLYTIPTFGGISLELPGVQLNES
jgi:hypothetical protein